MKTKKAQRILIINERTGSAIAGPRPRKYNIARGKGWGFIAVGGRIVPFTPWRDDPAVEQAR